MDATRRRSQAIQTRDRPRPSGAALAFGCWFCVLVVIGAPGCAYAPGWANGIEAPTPQPATDTRAPGLSEEVSPGSQAPPPIRPMEVWGYVPDFDQGGAWSAAEANRAALSGVTLFQYHLTANGNVVEYPGLGSAPGWPAESGLTVVPMITNHIDSQWNRDVVTRAIGDPGRRRQHVERILSLAVDGGYPRVELDYENLSAADREPFSAFVDELAAALHARGKQLSVAVHAKASEPGEWSGAQAQDWSRIGAAADWVIVMTYDHDPSRPGPIAPLAWTRAVLRFAATRIPPGKIIQGIPLYGYEWSGNAPGADRTYSQLRNLAHNRGIEPRRDTTDRHLVLEYTERGIQHAVWLADADTVAALAAVGRDVGVAGYALWRLGGEDPAVWSLPMGLAR